jgi:hypothetical protein
MTKSEFSAAVDEASSSTFSLGILDEAPTESGVLERQKVFRVGEFTDSRGRKNAWTPEDLDAMVSNFELLAARGILPNVPVRIDHTSSMKDVVGWFKRLYRDPLEPDFLFADIEFTEPDAYSKWQRKTLRNRSIEIGVYETNDGETFSPVVLGLAFVDLPAVEGLFSKNRASGFSPSSNDDSASDDQSSDPGASDSASNHEKGNAVPGTDNNQSNQTPPESTSDHGTQTTPPTSDHGRVVETHSFTINCQETSDYAAVQAHIESLETFREAAIEDSRTSFVLELAKEGKIGNPQVEAFSKLAISMTHAQFDDFKAGFESAPAHNLFGTHDLGDGGESDPTGDDRLAQEIADLEEIVANHKRRGVSDEDLKGMKSFQRLETLKAQS